VPPWTLPPKLTVLGSARNRRVIEDMGAAFCVGLWGLGSRDYASGAIPAAPPVGPAHPLSRR
jgi:hypothetical protein